MALERFFFSFQIYLVINTSGVFSGVWRKRGPSHVVRDDEGNGLTANKACCDVVLFVLT